jgi:hypothetical protein
VREARALGHCGGRGLPSGVLACALERVCPIARTLLVARDASLSRHCMFMYQKVIGGRESTGLQEDN